MSSSRPPALAPARRRSVPRRDRREYTRLRPAFVYALAATVAIAAAEAVRHLEAASGLPPARRSARAVPGRAPPAPSDGFDPEPRVRATPAPAAAEPVARAPADEEEEEPGIAPEDWRPPPPPNPDPSARPAVDDVWPNQGPESGGARVQLRGRNLDPAFVLFGRRPARILAVDASDGSVVLTLTAPPRTGPPQAWIVVTNRDGSTVTPAEPFHYYR